MITVTTVLLSLLWLLLIVYAIFAQSPPPNYPPGPRWWPFLGNGIMLRKLAVTLKGQHLALQKLARDYGTSVLGLRLGGEYLVVGFSPSTVKDILSREEFTGRPDSFFMRLRCLGKRQGVTACDGSIWQQQRAFVIRHLKVFGLWKLEMEETIQEEVRALVQYLREERQPLHMGQVLSISILSILWRLVAGKRLERTDGQLMRLLELLNTRSRAFDMAGGYLNQFPWLRFVAPEKTGYSLLKALNAELKAFLTELVKDHKESYDPRVTRDLIDAFLHRMYSNADDDHRSVYTDSQLIAVLLDLFIAGSQTTGNTLDFLLLYMLHHPSVQDKVYECLRENVGDDGVVTMKDRSRFAYVEAVIAEVQRLCNVVPLAGPRRCLRDTSLNGHFIPEGSTLLISLWSVHMDETLFPDPETFLPERFLDSDGMFVQNSNLVPFGLGKRRCLGDILAKSCIFLIFSGLMLHFRVAKPPGGPEPSLEPLHGITLSPQKYLAEFVPR